MAYYNGKKLIGFKFPGSTELAKQVKDLEEQKASLEGQVNDLSNQVEAMDSAFDELHAYAQNIISGGDA